MGRVTITRAAHRQARLTVVLGSLNPQAKVDGIDTAAKWKHLCHDLNRADETATRHFNSKRPSGRLVGPWK